jgi:hypothetical protein
MRFRMLILAGILQTGSFFLQQSCLAQTNAQAYVLVSGSLLTDDCPFCDRLAIILPLTGSFSMSLEEQNPLFSRYLLQDISWSAGSNSGPQYYVSGSGMYQVGGEVAYLQDLFLDVEVAQNSFRTNHAYCESSNRTVTVTWPKLQIHVDQTNGTPGQVFRFDLVAVPAPIIKSCVPDMRTGSFHLEWDATGYKYQIERATNASGPYVAVTGISTNSSFTDVGVLTNSPRFFYRLLKY